MNIAIAKKWVLGVLVFALGAGMSAQSAIAKRVELTAEVVSLIGGASYRESGSVEWKPVSTETRVGSGDTVRTEENGQATLKLDDGSTVFVDSGTEFLVQTLAKDSDTEQSESIFGLPKGKLKAQVTPLDPGSVFNVETPVVVASVKGTTLTPTVNADGSVSVASDGGKTELEHEGENRFRAVLEDAEALIEYDPATGVIRITNLKGTFDVVDPEGVTHTLNLGDVLVISGGAATYIPVGSTDTSLLGTFLEPASGS